MYQNVVFYRFWSITKRVKSGHILAERWELDTGAQVFQGAHELLSPGDRNSVLVVQWLVSSDGYLQYVQIE
jgi:hypothetical protein